MLYFSKKNYNYTILFVIILAICVRLLGLDKGIWGDEDFSIAMISNKSLWQMLQDLRTDTHPPLHYIFLYLWSKISHREEFLRCLALIFDLGTLILVVKWLEKYSYLAGILGGIFWATTPMSLRFSQEIRSYSLLVFATALVFFFASRLIDKPEKSSGYIGLAFSLTVAVSTHLVGIMLLAPICVFILLMKKEKRIHFCKAVMALSIPVIVFLFFDLFYLFQLSNHTAYWWMPKVSFQLILSNIDYVLGFSSLNLPSYLDHINEFIIFGFFSILVAFGAWQRNFPFLITVIIYWLEVIIYSIVKTPIFWYRNLLPSLIPLIGFIVLQITTIQKKKIKIACLIVFMTFSLIFLQNWITNQAWKPIEDFKPVAQLVQSRWQKRDLILFYPGYITHQIVHYFTELPSESIIEVTPGNDLKEVQLEINQKVATINEMLIRNNNIYLIIRVDLLVPKELEKYSQLLEIIKSKLKRTLELNVFLIISHDLTIVRDFETVPKMLNILESKFGKPSSYKDFKSYIESHYKLPSQNISYS
ncbi:glycosyltransferase family 39 protein [Aetokthonos hydrillicola]|jgi:hypothetical protein|nr:glycosyltransferase family 39 protein [Aetokthonos hydrillicola]